jgi:S-formylglutathione hydrolase FrmB
MIEVMAGETDPFLPGDRAFIAALRAGGMGIELHTAPGGHDDGYWDGRWRDYLRFYAAALQACRRG